MGTHDQSEDDGVIEAGIFTRLRPLAAWVLVAVFVAAIARWILIG